MNPKTVLFASLLLIGFAHSSDAIADSFKMTDANNGWLQYYDANAYVVLHTTDGGLTWRDVTPRPFPDDPYEFTFAKSQMAWISAADSLLLTTNGGKSWAKALMAFDYFTEGSKCKFYDANHGVAKIGSWGGGSVEYNFFETQDGGITWKPVNIYTPPKNPSGRPGGSIILSSPEGDDVAYEPPARVVITYGESLEISPAYVVHIALSSNSGKSWRDLRLPLPAKYSHDRNRPFPPTFFGQKDGILPVQILREAPDGYETGGVLVFYVTRDGGKTWTQRPALGKFGKDAELLRESDLDIVTFKDIFLLSGENLYATHDGALSWEIITPKPESGLPDPHRQLGQIDFVDANHGWIPFSDDRTSSAYGKFALYKTSDGGRTWARLSLHVTP